MEQQKQLLAAMRSTMGPGVMRGHADALAAELERLGWTPPNETNVRTLELSHQIAWVERHMQQGDISTSQGLRDVAAQITLALTPPAVPEAAPKQIDEDELKKQGWISPADVLHSADVEAAARQQKNNMTIVYEVVRIIDHPSYAGQLALIEGPCGDALTLKLLEQGGTVSPVAEQRVQSVGLLAVPTIEVSKLRDTVRSPLVQRVIAWLVRNEEIASPEAIERAVTSALDMKVGEAVTLDGDKAPLRRAFVMEQVGRLERAR